MECKPVKSGPVSGGKEGRSILPKALSIGGSDSGGGGGIQADLKTFEAFGVFGASVLTAVTAQNTMGIQEILCLPPELVGSQVDSVMTDLKPASIKTGMLGTPGIIRAVVRKIEEYRVRKVVVDPVLEATSGGSLLETKALALLKDALLPLALVVTPNLAEAAALTGNAVAGREEMKAAAREIKSMGPAYVVIKGGHSLHSADDLVYDGKRMRLLFSPRVTDKKVHGTGCVFSAAIAAGLARGFAPLAAIKRAKFFMMEGLKKPLKPGRGSYTFNWDKTRLSF